MIFAHLPESALLALSKHYDILLCNGCKNQENIVRFKEECLTELKRRYDLYQKKSV